MKVFVIGATGFFGSTIVEVLQKAGHDIIGLARSEISAKKLRRHDVSVCLGNLKDPETLLPAVQEADAVIQAIHVENNWDVAKTLIHNLAGSKKNLICTSGSNVYGGSGDNPVDETVEPEPGPIRDYENFILDGADMGFERSSYARP